MEPVVVLAHDETVRLDTDKLAVLYDELGPSEANRVVNGAIKEVAHRLSVIEEAYYGQDRQTLNKAMKTLPAIADQVGMTALARVARDASDCAAAGDTPAFAATLARLIRLGDRSLSAVWELQDISI